MEVPRLGVKLELQLPAHARATATAMQDPSHVCNLHHSSWECQILNPLSKVRDRTQNLMVPIRIHFYCTTLGTPRKPKLYKEDSGVEVCHSNTFIANAMVGYMDSFFGGCTLRRKVKDTNMQANENNSVVQQATFCDPIQESPRFSLEKARSLRPLAR